MNRAELITSMEKILAAYFICTKMELHHLSIIEQEKKRKKNGMEHAEHLGHPQFMMY